jgi:hypothetical protein
MIRELDMIYTSISNFSEQALKIIEICLSSTSTQGIIKQNPINTQKLQWIFSFLDGVNRTIPRYRHMMGEGLAPELFYCRWIQGTAGFFCFLELMICLQMLGKTMESF